ncbi:hypothetical protein [Streptomyces sp. NPDC091209]|uniref:hypothetical protein n=1 Tax=Streptomyces sp. NPDC091209 TaxID=3365974 RepID=UPI003820F4B3
MAEYEGVDPLLAAITDEALPEGARYDVLFMAEHQAASADMDVLREQLVIIGDALAGSGKAAGPARASRKGRTSKASGKPGRSRTSGGDQRAQGAGAPGVGRPGGVPKRRSWRPGAIAVGTLAAAAVTAVVVGMGWLIVQGGNGGANVTGSADAKSVSPGAGAGISAPRYIACSRLIAEGTVTKVLQVPGTAQDRITLDVYHYYKPAEGEKEVTFLMDRDARPRLTPGEEVLVGIQQHAVTPDIWTTGEGNIARDRSWIVKALPESQAMKCTP